MSTHRENVLAYAKTFCEENDNRPVSKDELTAFMNERGIEVGVSTVYKYLRDLSAEGKLKAQTIHTPGAIGRPKIGWCLPDGEPTPNLQTTLLMG